MTLRVLGIAGSLRSGSYNRALLRAAGSLSPEGMVLEAAEIRDLPLYDADLEAHGMPEPVRLLRERIAAADALLFATPEYNYSIPGVHNNAIDWVSRGSNQPLDGKPVAIMGASAGAMGSARAQYHLRQCFIFLNMYAVNQPQVLIANAAQRFNEKGELTDESSRELVRKLLAELVSWTNRLRK